MAVGRQTVGYLTLILISALLSYILVGSNQFPSFALAIFFTSVATLVYTFQRVKTNFLTLLFAAILILSFFLLLRANPILIFLNCVAILFLGSVLIEQSKHVRFGFLHAFFSPLLALLSALTTKNQYAVSPKVMENQFQRYFVKAPEVARGLIITFIVLIIIIPLLSSANPIFGNLVESFFKLFNIPAFLEALFTKPTYVVRALFFLILMFFLPRLLSYVNTAPKEDQKPFKLFHSIDLVIPKVAVAAILVIFFITQMQLYFADSQTLQALGYNNSKLTREVFGQLSVVTFIIFLLVFNDKKESRVARISTLVLIIEGLFLGAIATKSVFDYINAWGFTHKRLYGVATVVWLFGIFGLFADKYLLHQSNTRFVRNTILFSALVLIGINVANFDHLIYHKAKATTGEGIDHFYLSKLSADADSYRVHLETLMPEIEKNGRSIGYKNTNAAFTVIGKIEGLRRKYGSSDFRSFNIAEYRQYKDTLDLPIEDYRVRLQAIYNEPYTEYETSRPLTPPPTPTAYPMSTR